MLAFRFCFGLLLLGQSAMLIGELQEAFQAGVSEEQALETVLPRLSQERAIELANECIQLYMWDRLGSEN